MKDDAVGLVVVAIGFLLGGALSLGFIYLVVKVVKIALGF